jgi:hypothetical protein
MERYTHLHYYRLVTYDELELVINLLRDRTEPSEDTRRFLQEALKARLELLTARARAVTSIPLKKPVSSELAAKKKWRTA